MKTRLESARDAEPTLRKRAAWTYLALLAIAPLALVGCGASIEALGDGLDSDAGTASRCDASELVDCLESSPFDECLDVHVECRSDVEVTATEPQSGCDQALFECLAAGEDPADCAGKHLRCDADDAVSGEDEPCETLMLECERSGDPTLCESAAEDCATGTELSCDALVQECAATADLAVCRRAATDCEEHVGGVPCGMLVGFCQDTGEPELCQWADECAGQAPDDATQGCAQALFDCHASGQDERLCADEYYACFAATGSDVPCDVALEQCELAGLESELCVELYDRCHEDLTEPEPEQTDEGNDTAPRCEDEVSACVAAGLEPRTCEAARDVCLETGEWPLESDCESAFEFCLQSSPPDQCEIELLECRQGQATADTPTEDCLPPFKLCLTSGTQEEVCIERLFDCAGAPQLRPACNDGLEICSAETNQDELCQLEHEQCMAGVSLPEACVLEHDRCLEEVGDPAVCAEMLTACAGSVSQAEDTVCADAFEGCVDDGYEVEYCEARQHACSESRARCEDGLTECPQMLLPHVCDDVYRQCIASTVPPEDLLLACEADYTACMRKSSSDPADCEATVHTCVVELHRFEPEPCAKAALSCEAEPAECTATYEQCLENSETEAP